MTSATNTTAGQIVLGGDLSGDGTAPSLRATGVAPGSYNGLQRVSVDSKGRITAAGTFTTETLAGNSGALPTADGSTRGIVRIGNHISVASAVISTAVATSTTPGIFSLVAPLINVSGTVAVDYSAIADATTSNKGLMQVGSGLDVTAGVISRTVPDATTSSKGKVQVGTNLSVSGGVLSAGFGDATTSAKGIVSVAAPLQVSGGVVSMPYADYTTKGIVQVGSGLAVSSGVLSCTYGPAGATQLGLVKLSSDFEPSTGTWSVPIASATQRGYMVVGSNLQIIGGVLSTIASITDATTSTKGIVQVGTGLAISGGVLSVSLPDATTSTKGIAQVGSGFSISSGILSVPAFPNATTSTKGVVQVGTGLAISGGVLSLSTVADAAIGSKGIAQIATGGYLAISSGLLSYTVPDATTSSKGTVQIATNGGIDVTSGVISSRLATGSLKGIVQPGAGVSISGNQISVSYATVDATTSSKGVVQIGSGLAVTSGSVSIPDATTGAKGIVQIATNGGVDVTSGVISSKLATTSLKGIVQPGTSVSISGNTISIADATTSTKGIAQFDSTYFTVSSAVASLITASNTVYGTVIPADTTTITVVSGGLDVGTNIPKKSTTNTYTKCQVAALVTDTYAATYTPDFSASNTFEVVLTGNVSIANPTNVVAGGVYTVILTQDGTGGRTLTLSGSAFKTNQTLTLSTAANARDVLTFIAKSSSEIYVLMAPGF